MATKALCSIPDCGKVAKTRGLCTRHYQSARASGEISVKVRKGRDAGCNVEGCSKRQIALGMCSFHYRRRKRGDDLEAPRLTAKGAPRAFLDAFPDLCSNANRRRSESGPEVGAGNCFKD